MVMGLIKSAIELGVAWSMFSLKVSQSGITTTQSLLGRHVTSEGGIMLTDSEYAKHRVGHPISKVLRESSSDIVIETIDGHRERWSKPQWKLTERD